jgi:hypothetical protein
MIVMSLPGRRFRSMISSVYSYPLIRVELFHARGSSRVADTTNLGTLLM